MPRTLDDVGTVRSHRRPRRVVVVRRQGAGVARRPAGRPSRRDRRDRARSMPDRAASPTRSTTSPTATIRIPLRREPGRITIGTDPTDDRSRPMPRKGRPGEPTRGGRPARSGSTARPPATAGEARADATCRRPSPSASCIAVVFVVAVLWQPEARAGRRRRRARPRRRRVLRQGHREGLPAGHVVGIVACVATPLAAYWVGERALPLIIVLGVRRRRRSRSSARRASKPARCRTWPSPRWASCGSACSARSRR